MLTSGGKYIAQELAKRFNIKCYDYELLAMLAKDTNVDIKHWKKLMKMKNLVSGTALLEIQFLHKEMLWPVQMTYIKQRLNMK